jgi:hypothetical protein
MLVFFESKASLSTKVEMQVRTDVDKDALDSKKTSMEESIKETIKKVAVDKKEADIPVTVSCGKANARGTKTNMVCKIDAKDAAKAGKVEAYTRDPAFKTELKTKFNGKTRRLNGRHLSATSMDVESSQSLAVVGTSTNTNTNANTNTNTNTNKKPGGSSGNSPSAADDDEDILSISSRKSMSSLLTIIVGIVAAYLLL